MGLSFKLAGLVVYAYRAPPVRIGRGNEVSCRIIIIADGLTTRANFTTFTIGPVVRITGGVVVGICDAEQIITIVVVENGTLVERVDDLDQSVEGVVTVLGNAAFSVGCTSDVAYIIVCGGSIRRITAITHVYQGKKLGPGYA
ncbi:hypothetical protein A3194_14125 [Candidatus Thiodiazotropha endoloripes]|nr:hypothetical protein A3194_14125 [Candidatus Thiodiazotropha endoloripes]